MKQFIVYNSNGQILRTGCCADQDIELQAGKGELIMEGFASDRAHKIVGGRIVDKTPEEIEAETLRPRQIPDIERPADISKGQWQMVLNRLEQLEAKVT